MSFREPFASTSPDSYTKSSTVSNPTKPFRIPREIKRFPRNPLKDDAQLQRIFGEIRPYLLKAAYHISRPYYIDAEDLVQEAFIKIYRNRDKYDGNLNTSLKTWLVNVALRHFYSIAITEYRMKRVPQGMHLCKAMISIHEENHSYKNHDQYGRPLEEDLSEYLRPFHPYNNEVEYELRYKEIIERTESRLKPFTRKVFNALLEPPQQLVDKVFETQRQFIADRESGISTKVPFQFSITAQHLAEYFGVPKYKITKAKNVINDAIKKAIED